MTRTSKQRGERRHGLQDSERSLRLFGVPVSPWSADELIMDTTAAAQGRAHRLSGPQVTIGYANPHVLNMSVHDRVLREQLQSASTVICDGSGVRLGARILGRRLPPRLAAADWIDDLCATAAEKGIPIYFLAGNEGVAKRAAAVLTSRHAGLRIPGAHHGYLTPELSRNVVDDINGSGASIVLVGMGTPVQEHWIAKYRPSIKAPVVWAVGAVLDFVTGEQRRSPAWIRRLHLEWLWRLGSDPVRLWRRYVIGNPLFLLRVARQRLTGWEPGVGNPAGPSGPGGA